MFSGVVALRSTPVNKFVHKVFCCYSCLFVSFFYNLLYGCDDIVVELYGPVTDHGIGPERIGGPGGGLPGA